jgi:hypothetical protein
MLTYQYLKEILFYEPETGLFFWKIRKAYNIKAGSVAGTLHKSGYIYISVDNKCQKAHRLAWFYMTGEMPTQYIDHINRIANDNRFANLRLASPKQNCENCKMYKSNASGFRGVSFHKASNKWRATLSHNKKQIHLGIFDTAEEASFAAETKRNELFTHHIEVA